MLSNDANSENIQDFTPGIVTAIDCYKFSDGNWSKHSVSVPQEITLTVFVNNQELVSTLCTPTKLNCLVVGLSFFRECNNRYG